MTTATELLRRALDVMSYWSESKATDLMVEIRTYLAAEPEAEQDLGSPSIDGPFDNADDLIASLRKPEKEAEPDDKDEIHQMQLAAISLAARGNWKKGDKISPKYETPALHDVAKLYADASKFVPEPRSWETHEEFIRELAAVNGIPIDEKLFTGSPKPTEPEAEPVAWGHPNTAITGKNQPLMMVNLEIPSNAQYPQLWVPLYLHPPRPEPETKAKHISDESLRNIKQTLWDFICHFNGNQIDLGKTCNDASEHIAEIKWWLE